LRDYAISGYVKEGFETVKEAFIENFKRGKEIGAAFCAYYRGERVVDLWGGKRNNSTGEPWGKDTMVMVFSATKGIAGLVLAIANSRGLFNYDERVSTYWPEFAQNNKEKITVRHLLSQQAGLFALDEKLDAELVRDLDELAIVLARQKPKWEPGMYQAYHAFTLGFYENELFRRIDPKKRSIGRFFQEELANPLDLDFYIGLPESIPNNRLASLKRFSIWSLIFLLFRMPSLTLSLINPRSNMRRSLSGSKLLEEGEKNRIYPRDLEIPSAGGVGTARALAQVYSIFAMGGQEIGIREDTLQQLMKDATPPVYGFYDKCLKTKIRFSLGFIKPNPNNPFGHPSSFGFPGIGGSFGFADPHNKIGYAYLTNKMGLRLIDPREKSIRIALYNSIDESDPYF
jgi:CubicO group peptidase (beta-lactamase class C family)